LQLRGLIPLVAHRSSFVFEGPNFFITPHYAPTIQPQYPLSPWMTWLCCGRGYGGASPRTSRHPAAGQIAAALQLQLQRYAAAPAEHCYELHTCRGGATRPTRHRMMFFYWTFGALVPFELQGCQHQGGQRDEAHGYRAPGTARPRVARPRARRRIANRSTILKS
jgi:hypothetical protein